MLLELRSPPVPSSTGRTRLLLLLLFGAQLSVPAVTRAQAGAENLEVVQRLVDAFNAHDEAAMSALVAPDFELYYVDEAGVAERAVSGPADLEAQMSAYFDQNPTVRSSISSSVVGPRFVAIREQILGGASSLAVYEVRGGRIARVWYYPPESTDMATPRPLTPADRIVFFGDSITEAGVGPDGYVTLFSEAISQRPSTAGAQVFGAGISGNKVPDLLTRLDRDVLALDPTVVVIYIGINDVWHWYRFDPHGTSPGVFEAGLAALIEKLTDRQIRVVAVTPSVIGEKWDGSNEADSMLEDFATLTRRVAAAAGIQVCDLRNGFLQALRRRNPENRSEGVFTTDGVHLNEAGNRWVADRFLACLGVTGL